jgi:hypothetical protein
LKYIRRLAGLVLAIGALASAAAIWAMESDVRAYGRAVASAEPYWACDPLPSREVLVRMYARAVIASEARGLMDNSLRWHTAFFAYESYVSARLGEEELAYSFVRVPSQRERGCARIGAFPA